MPAVRKKAVKLYQTYWKRVAREFCDACGMIIKDDHFFKWTVTYVDRETAWIDLDAASHTNPTCAGLVMAMLLSPVPAEAERL